MFSNCKFSDEFITQLDPLLDSNRGGPSFRSQLFQMLKDRGVSKPRLELDVKFQIDFALFVKKIDKLLELLLNYRQVRLNSDCVENGMFCTVQLIDFYHSIDQDALYVSYL